MNERIFNLLLYNLMVNPTSGIRFGALYYMAKERNHSSVQEIEELFTSLKLLSNSVHQL